VRTIVKIPLTSPRCEICGSISVNLDSVPTPCPFHDFCPPCGGTKKGWWDVPQFCPIHVCDAWHRTDRHCSLRAGHDGDHWWASNGGIFFAQLDLLGTVIECRHTVGYDTIDDQCLPRYEWKPEIARTIDRGYGNEAGPRLNGWESDRWRVPA
jgi:hypothetical protein